MIANPTIQGGGAGKLDWKTGTFSLVRSEKMSYGSITIDHKKGQSIVVTSQNERVLGSYVIKESMIVGGCHNSDWYVSIGLVTDTSVRIDVALSGGTEGEFEYCFVVF